MKHYYQNIGENWFSYPKLYASMVDKYNDAVFVEVGSWKGRSSCYMGVEIINSGKNIKLYCVDTWNGDFGTDRSQRIIDNELYLEFIKNISPILKVVEPVRKDSLEAALSFSDESLDFVFIDATHNYECVKKDIAAWYPKVKKGGTLAGHDYSDSWPEVRRAVDEWCAMNDLKITASESCWIHDKV